MYGYYFLLGVVLGILLGEVDELELPFHPLLTTKLAKLAPWVEFKGTATFWANTGDFAGAVSIGADSQGRPT